MYTFQLLALWKLRAATEQKAVDGISVVVCAHNEAENLKQLVPLLLAQKYPEKEIIIVDDRSHDESYDYLIDLKPQIKLVRIDSVPDYANGKKFGLTMGIKAATHDRIIFTDADCRPATDQWLTNMAQQFTDDKSFIIGYSQYLKQGGFLNLFIRYETLVTGIHYLARAKFIKPYMAVGRNMGYRKSFFMDKKGFGQNLKIMGGDDDLFINQYAKKSNTAVILAKEATVFSVPKTSWKTFFTQKKRHLSVGKHYRSIDKITLAIKSLFQLLFWGVFILGMIILNKPYHLLGAFALKVIWQGVTLWIATKKSGEKFDFWLFPFLDLFYSLYLAIMGTIAGFSKKVKWS